MTPVYTFVQTNNKIMPSWFHAGILFWTHNLVLKLTRTRSQNTAETSLKKTQLNIEAWKSLENQITSPGRIET